MSSYQDSQTQISEDQQQKNKELFRYDTSLLKYIDFINQWKQNLSLSTLSYLLKQKIIVSKQHDILSCGTQVRAIAFCFMLRKGFHQLVIKYKKAYAELNANPSQIYIKIQQLSQLDQQLQILSKYLILVQANNILSIFAQLQQDTIKNIYNYLRQAIDYCLDIHALWVAMSIPRTFRPSEQQNLYKVNYSGTLLYYQKQLTYLFDRIKRCQVKTISPLQNQKHTILIQISTIIANQKIKSHLKTKIISLLKGQYYTNLSNNNLSSLFIRSSFQMYYGEEVSELWDYQKYQELCIDIIKHSFHNFEFIDYLLFLQPETIVFERRKKTIELAQLFYAILQKIVSLKNQPKSQQLSLVTTQIPLQFIQTILNSNLNTKLLGILYVNFMQSYKNALSLNSYQLDKLLFGILENLRQIYLSFGTNQWITHCQILSALNSKFFSKFSQEIKSWIVTRLPIMIESLGQGKFPTFPQIHPNNHQQKQSIKISSELITGSQLLKSIFYYIHDAQYKDQNFYLDLPQVTPSSFQTALMFINTLQLKLKYHQPTQDQKKLWTMIIEQSVDYYKIKVNLNWFKSDNQILVKQRQGQYLIHKTIQQEWSFNLLQTIFNHRDQQKYQQIFSTFDTMGKYSLQNDIIDYFKYCINIKLNQNLKNHPLIQQQDAFNLLDKMGILLTNNYQDIIHLNHDQIIIINQLHLCLHFYNTKVQYAKNNQIYQQIVQIIILPWILNHDYKVCQYFQQLFPCFFAYFILHDYCSLIQNSLIDVLANETSPKQNTVMKLQFFADFITKLSTTSQPTEINTDILPRLFSLLTQTTDIQIIIQLFLLGFKYQQITKQIQLGILVDFIIQQHRFNKFLQLIKKLDYYRLSKIILQLILKLSSIFYSINTDQLNSIIQIYFNSQFYRNDPDHLLNVLQSIPKQKYNLELAILKAFVAQKNRQLYSKNDKESIEKALAYWKKLQQYVDKILKTNTLDKQRINLQKLTKNFQQPIIKKLQTNNKRFLQDSKSKLNPKKKSSKQNELFFKQQLLQQKQLLNDIYTTYTKIWKNILINFGSFQDIILFGQDPLEIVRFTQQQISNDCLKIIQEKSIHHKYLKKIIKKLPILLKCGQDTINKLEQQQKINQSQFIHPQLLYKLIIINSCYKSNIIQNFIIQNISSIPIPIKIYQDYLIKSIKNKLQNIPENLIYLMIYGDLGYDNIRKINQAFDLIVYMPIKKFQFVHLSLQNKIIQNLNDDNQSWQTLSQKLSNQDDEQQLSSGDQQKKKQSQKQKKRTSHKHPHHPKQHQSSAYDQLPDDQYFQQIPLQPNSPSNDQQQNDHSQDLSDSHQNYSQQQSQHTSKLQIVNMFYQQDNENLLLYKQFIKIRQQLNIQFDQNYRSLQKLQHQTSQTPQIQKKLFRIVQLFQNQFTQQQIITQILNKLPYNLYLLLKNNGLTKQRNQLQINKYRKLITKMPRFINDYMSDRDQNSVNDSSFDDSYEDQIYQEADDLSSETSSSDDNSNAKPHHSEYNDQQLGEDALLAHPSNDQYSQSQQQCDDQKQNKKIKSQRDNTYNILSLSHLKQINSKIQSQLTGNQLNQLQIIKILQISIIKLFSLHIYQLKHKPVLSFYKDLLSSNLGKIFLDTFITILRIDQHFDDLLRFNFNKKLYKFQLTIPKALNNLLQIACQICSQDTKQTHDLGQKIRTSIGHLLPIGDEILIKSNLPFQDNYLTLLIFYSRYTQKTIHQKLKKLLSSLNSNKHKYYQINKLNTLLLTKNIYYNNNSSSIWNNIQDNFGVHIQMKIKFNSCLKIYGSLLRKDLQKCYHWLFDIINNQNNQFNQNQNKQIILKQQQKKIQQNLKKHFKRIKHYYYWNKRNIINQISTLNYQPIKLLKDKQLIKLTQLMIFYCHFIKSKFFGKIHQKVMKNLLILPKSIIQTSFMFLWKLKAKINQWKPLNIVKQFFNTYKLYQHKFTKLQQVCNLILQLLQIPQFSNSKFKQVIIPYFINNPKIAHQIPLIFKLPDIPQQLNGQKLYLTRQCSFDMGFYQLMGSSFLISLHNQEGSDHGGMVRQIMMGWKGVGIGEQYVFIGKILGFSFKKSIPYGGKFDVAMAVAITQYQVTMQFMEQVQPQVAQNLKYIEKGDPQDLQLKFQIIKQEYGTIKHYPLITNGQNISVTKKNKHQYIKHYLQKYFIAGRQWQIEQLCIGFYSIINKNYISIFHPLQLIKKIEGKQINNYLQLKQKTIYQQGYTQSSQIIQWFWSILAEFNQSQMNKFLQFITGSPKLSIYNNSFEFVINKPYDDDSQRLPIAHTCYSTLDLPSYATKQILKKKLLQAIFQGNDNFGIL